MPLCDPRASSLNLAQSAHEAESPCSQYHISASFACCAAAFCRVMVRCNDSRAPPALHIPSFIRRKSDQF